MNAGKKTIDWFYYDQLRVDDEWAVSTEKGFTWWGANNAQTIEVLGEEKDETGETAYLISVRTEFLREVELTRKNLGGINGLLMLTASMAGPVYDEATGSLSLCSLVRIHEGIREWMSALISMASVLQISEADSLGKTMPRLLGAKAATSKHPSSGWRARPDELAGIVGELVEPMGKEQSQWRGPEFKDLVGDFVRGPGLCATWSKGGATVEFPYGDSTSLCRLQSDQPHPRYGSGLLVLQSFPVEVMSETEGARLALDLNAVELTQAPFGYGFGSYCYADGMIHFNGFVPNCAYRPGLLPNFYLTCAARALQMFERLACGCGVKN
jgi:hypothetical protein